MNKMDKNELHQKIIKKLSLQGINFLNVDPEKSCSVKNEYHLYDKEGTLLFKYKLNNLSLSKTNSSPSLAGCLILIPLAPGILLFIAFISTIFMPAIESTKTKVTISKTKEVLINRIKECLYSNNQKGSSNFTDASSLINSDDFKLEQNKDSSCFQAKAIPKNDNYTWFQIEYNLENGKFSKSCGDVSKQGCNEGNTW